MGSSFFKEADLIQDLGKAAAKAFKAPKHHKMMKSQGNLGSSQQKRKVQRDEDTNVDEKLVSEDLVGVFRCPGKKTCVLKYNEGTDSYTLDIKNEARYRPKTLSDLDVTPDNQRCDVEVKRTGTFYRTSFGVQMEDRTPFQDLQHWFFLTSKACVDDLPGLVFKEEIGQKFVCGKEQCQLSNISSGDSKTHLTHVLTVVIEKLRVNCLLSTNTGEHFSRLAFDQNVALRSQYVRSVFTMHEQPVDRFYRTSDRTRVICSNLWKELGNEASRDKKVGKGSASN